MNRDQIQKSYAAGDRNFQGLELGGADLSGLDLRNADFRESDLYGAKLMDSLLVQANFSENTNLAYADLRGADLSYANLSGASLDGARLEDVNARGAIYSDLTKFPAGFDPIAAGAVHIQEIERQTRTAHVATLKSLSQPPSTSESTIHPTASLSSAPLSSTQNADTSLAPPTVETVDETSSFPPTGFFDTTLKVAEPSSVPVTPSKKSSSNAWVGVVVGVFIILGGYKLIENFFKPFNSLQTSSNPFEKVQYPLSACGDPRPSNSKKFPVDLYPVFVNNSPKTLATVARQFCRDAYVTARKDSGVRSIQVASFNSRDKAKQFAEFMTKKVGSGKVGIPTRIYQ
jgi:Pentapeptide repeats (8 copies)